MGAPVLERFGGLDLISDPSEVAFARAIDLLNVDLDRVGRLRSRDGFAIFSGGSAPGTYHTLAPFYKTDGTKQLLAVYGGALGAMLAFGTNGLTIASQTLINTVYASVARFGGPLAEEAYIALSGATGVATIYKWNGTAFSVPAWSGTTPTGRHLAVTADFRLANARRNGATQGDTPSTIFFSDPGLPSTWTSTSFVEIAPGDGEEIMALVSWRELLFAFKQTKFAVISSPAVGAGGTPVWNTRLVTSQGLSGGAGGAAYRAVAVAPHGVYFANRRGIWFTDGGPPQLVSRDVDPLFVGNVSPFGPAALNQAAIDKSSLLWHDQRLWFAYPSGASTDNDRLLRFDPATDDWTLYSLGALAMASFRIGAAEEFVFALSGAPIALGLPQPAAALVAGGALAIGQSYFYKVTALNAAGETVGSPEVTATASAAPAAPANVHVISSGPNAGTTAAGTYYYKVVAFVGAAMSPVSAEVSFTAPVAGGSGSDVYIGWDAVPGATKYRIYRGTGAPGSEDRWTEQSGSNTGFVDYPINGNTSVNNTWTLGAPAAAQDARSVQLTWPAVLGATGYRVYRGTVAGAENVFFAPGNVVTFTDTGGAGTAGAPPGVNTATVTGNDVGRHSPAYTADGGNGTTTGAQITSRYRTGFAHLGDGAQARLREILLHGSGTVEVRGANDFGALDAAVPVALGASPVIAEGRYRQARRGRNVSLEFSDLNGGAWLLARAQLIVDSVRRVAQR